MDTFDAIQQRRSIKSFDIHHKMSKEEINKLLGTAIFSPTSYNIQNWRFVTITEQSLKDKICELSYGQRQVSEASLIIILCADLNSWKKSPERYWNNVPEDMKKSLVSGIRSTFSGNPQNQRDEAIRSCSIAAQTIMLAAKAMGYDTCPMVGFDFDKVGKLIRLPQDHIIVMMIVVGKKAADPYPRGGQLSLDEVVFENHF